VIDVNERMGAVARAVGGREVDGRPAIAEVLAPTYPTSIDDHCDAELAREALATDIDIFCANAGIAPTGNTKVKSRAMARGRARTRTGLPRSRPAVAPRSVNRICLIPLSAAASPARRPRPRGRSLPRFR
jgi:hypothetical protein